MIRMLVVAIFALASVAATGCHHCGMGRTSAFSPVIGPPAAAPNCNSCCNGAPGGVIVQPGPVVGQ